MADTIAVMNQGVIEQLGAPQEIYDRPAQHVRRRLHRLAGDELPRLRRRGRAAAPRRRRRRRRRSPCRRCARTRRGERSCSACGPSTCASPTTAPLRGEVFGAEYLGTRQIVTVDTEAGRLRVRAPPTRQRAARGEHVGLAFDARASSSLFDPASERALRLAPVRAREARHG